MQSPRIVKHQKRVREYFLHHIKECIRDDLSIDDGPVWDAPDKVMQKDYNKGVRHGCMKAMHGNNVPEAAYRITAENRLARRRPPLLGGRWRVMAADRGPGIDQCRASLARALWLIAAAALSIPVTVAIAGGFTLNWQQDHASEGASVVNNDAYFCGGLSYMNCAGGGGAGWGGSSGNDDGTPFLQETLDLNGQRYFHLIVGDHTTDSMAQEVFIQVSPGNNSKDGITFSDSLCNNCSESRQFSAGDALNSNSNFNGNGGGNPSRVMMQQMVKDGSYQGQFLKDSFTQKPLINSTVSTPDMISTVILDMRGSDYSQITPIGLSNVTITQTMLGPDKFGTSGNFDIQTQGQHVDVTAGGFTYTPGPSSSGGGGGVYTYFEGTGFNPLNFDYAAYCDPSQNAAATGSGRGGGGFGGFGSGGGAACGGSGGGGGRGW